VKTIRVGVARVRECNTQQLRRELAVVSWKEGESVEDFSVRITGLANKLRILGNCIPDAVIVRKMLEVVPEHLEHIADSIETLLDLNTVSIEEVTGRLRAVEQRRRKPAPVVDNQGRLLLTHEEWMAKLKIGGGFGEKGSSSNSGGSNAGAGNKRGGGVRGRGRTNSSAPRQAPGAGEGMGQPKKSGKCNYCNKKGHWAKECRSRIRDEAHLAQATQEEDGDNEPALLMARGLLTSDPLSSPPRTAGGRRPLEVVEVKVFAQLDAGEDDRDESVWHLDTGATNHMSGCRLAFHNLDSKIHDTVKFGDSSVVPIEGAGTVILRAKTGEHIPITGVYFIPRLTTNIVSLGHLDEGGCDVRIKHGLLRVRDKHDRLIAKVQRSANRLYSLRVNIARPLCLMAHRADGPWLWHERYGHLHFDALRKLSKEKMVDGLPPVEHVHQLCTDCVATKLKRRPFPAQAKRRADDILDLVHGDLCGPISPATPGGKSYFLLLVDDHSRFMWLSLLSNKGDTLEAIQRFQARVEVETGQRLRVLRTDHGGEFTSVAFEEHCNKRGITRQHSAPYTPQQNGVVERRNQSVVTMARSLLKGRGVPAAFWGEAVSTAVFLLNRAPTKSVAGKTPFEAWHGRKPDVEFLRTFGCVAHVKTARPHLKKLEDRSTPMVFFGYEQGAKAWRFYDPVAQRVHVSRDAVFQEEASWDWSKMNDGKMERAAELIIDYSIEDSASEEVGAPSPFSNGGESASAPPTSAPTTTPTFVSPPSNAFELLDDDNDDVLPRFRTINSVLGPASSPGLAPRHLEAELFLQIGEEPATFAEAEQHEPWRKAMLEEMSSIESNDTWCLESLPPGHRPTGLKWVFKVKKNNAGEVIKYKARLVAKGYVQQPGWISTRSSLPWRGSSQFACCWH
jgi:transposase InsO family protein